MKALKALGDKKAEILHDLPIPKLRPDYVNVKVKAVALNPTDWKHIGFVDTRCTVGCDFSGVVEEVGSAVNKPWKKGDRVCGFVHGSNILHEEDGAFGDYATVKGDLLMRMPDSMDFEDAATLGVGIITVGQGMYQQMQLPMPGQDGVNGEPILIYGGSSATGMAGIQFAKLSGFTVITTCSPRNFELVKSLGADHAFDYSSPTCAADIRKLTGDKLKYAWDTISEGTSPKICAEALASSGDGLIYGTILRVNDFPRKEVKMTYSLGYTMVGEDVRFRGPTTIKAVPEDFEFGVMFTSLAEKLLSQGKIRPPKKEVREGGLEAIFGGLDDLKEGRGRDNSCAAGHSPTGHILEQTGSAYSPALSAFFIAGPVGCAPPRHIGGRSGFSAYSKWCSMCRRGRSPSGQPVRFTEQGTYSVARLGERPSTPKIQIEEGRLRRKKCDERTPLCERCTSSKRECIWPTRDALIDRRHGSRNGKTSPIQQDRSTSQVQHWNSESLKEPTKVDTAEPNISLESEAISQQLLRLELEPIISRHFVDTYYELLINPESHRDFYADWKDDLTALAKKSKGLHYAILANASSHLSLVDDSDSLHQVSLDFYSRSIRSLAHALGEGAPNPDTNAVLMSVMLLYLQGHVGEGTWHDIPYHVRAASRIIRLRFLQDPNFVITRPFERLAVESVLFQVFLVTTGHWSKQWKDHDYEFDVRFWLGCENLLNRCTLFPGRTTSCNSPVLGVPIPLFKLNLTIKRMCDHLGLVTAETLAHLKQEVLYWEAAIALGHERSTSHRSLCDDATFLYILIASLLVEQLENYAKDDSSIPPHPVATTKWQYESIFGILKRRHDDEGWHRTFVANWPVYTAGILVGTPDDQAFIREAMKRRWARSSIYMVARYSKDLERFWSGNQDIGGSPSSATESGSELSEM